MQRTHATVAGYSADTEILTRAGWKTFPDVSWDDEFASRSPEGRFEWERPTRIVRAEPYQGDMIWFHGRVADLLVTPHLRIPWMAEYRSPVRVWTAAEIYERPTRPRISGCLLATSAWEARDLPEVVIPGVRHTKMGPKPLDVYMSGDQYAAFMGMYIAEGCATAIGRDWLVTIAQTAGGKGHREYEDLLRDIFGRVPGGTPGSTWVIHSRALFDHLAPLGKARSKRLPDGLAEMSQRQLAIFWRYYFLGDGSYEHRTNAPAHHRDHEVVATASPWLAGQLQEIVQKLGSCGSVRKYKTRANSLVKTEGTIYKLRIRYGVRPSFRMDAVPYTGMIGHVRVPNGVIYVRRNGIPAWSG